MGGDDYDDDSLFIKRLGKGTRNQNSDPGANRGVDPEMSLSPDGAHLLLQTEATHVSSTWSEYEDQFLKLRYAPPRPKRRPHEHLPIRVGRHSYRSQPSVVRCANPESWIGDGLVA